jgi:cupin fold WbuC family metalloprotein
MGGFRKVNSAVFEPTTDPVLVEESDIASLKEAARASPSGRARLLLHPHRDDSFHEMVIALPPRSCDHPHINFKSGKSFLALSGQFAVMVFSDDGSEITPLVLSAEDKWRGGKMVRLSGAAWHTIIPLAGDTVFLESIIGPFEGNRFAPWFPGDESPPEEWEAYANKLRRIASDAVEQ